MPAPNATAAAPRRLVALVNPISGTAKKEAAVRQLREQAAARQLPLELLPTTANGQYGWLEEKIVGQGITDVVIVGGDGTVNQVVKALYHLPLQFSILPFGSGNGVAWAAGIPARMADAINLVFSGKGVATDAFLINGQFSCLLSGLGFDAQVAYDFANSGRRGFFSYAQQSLRQFFRAQPYQFSIETEGLQFFTDAYLLSVANSNQFGNNVTIAPSASLSDGLLDVVIVQKMSKLRLPFAVLRQIRGNNRLQQLVDDLTRQQVIYFQTPKVSITNPKFAPLHIDGEPRETAEKLVVDMLPGCWRLVHGAAVG